MKNWVKPEVSELEVSMTANGKWHALVEIECNCISTHDPNSENCFFNKDDDKTQQPLPVTVHCAVGVI